MNIPPHTQALALVAASASMLAASVALIAFARIKGLIGQGAPALATLIALMA